MNRESTEKTKKYLALAGIAIVIIGFVSFIFWIANLINNPYEDFQPEEIKIDDPSGLDVYETNYEDENSTTEDLTPVLIGFGALLENGISHPNKDIFEDLIRDYFKENYPDTQRVSYVRDSFRYLNRNNISVFELSLETDTEEMFHVVADTHSTYNNVTFTIDQL